MPDVLYYAVITLTSGEHNSLVKGLPEDGATPFTGWLRARPADTYGTTRSDWRPYGDTIEGAFASLAIDGYGAIEYKDRTDVIDGISDGEMATPVLKDAEVSVFFIDPCTIGVPKYDQLATELHMLLSEDLTHRCCFVHDDKRMAFRELRLRCKERWHAVWEAKRQGAPHAYALDEDDLEGFMRGLTDMPGKLQGAASLRHGAPTPQYVAAMAAQLGPHIPIPPMGG